MENEKTVRDTIFDKKVESYFNDEDFPAPHEIMVTITLHEYRRLVETNGRNSEKIKNLREELDSLKGDKKIGTN